MVRECKAMSNNADQPRRSVMHPYCPAGDYWILLVSTLPQAVAQNRDRCGPRRFVSRRKIPPEDRFLIQHAERPDAELSRVVRFRKVAPIAETEPQTAGADEGHHLE